MANKPSVKDQLARSQADNAALRRILNDRAPGQGPDGTRAWEAVDQLYAWLRELDDLAWPIVGRGMDTGTIGRTGHTDPTPEQAHHRSRGFHPDREQAHLVEAILRLVDKSYRRATGTERRLRRGRTPSTTRPTHSGCDRDHATTWLWCPWTGTPLDVDRAENGVANSAGA